jgi:uncharacterized membrane protein
MNCPFTLLLAAVLFFLLTPGVLVRLPPKCTLLTCAAFHAVVFTVALYFGSRLVKNLRRVEGLDEEKKEEEEKNM